MLTRKDFQLIAEVVAQSVNEAYTDQGLNLASLIAVNFAQRLQNENERFDRERFYGAINKLIETESEKIN